ncbi:hypothetical protein [Mesorhizobium sp. M9A.F.Ca.ET.002.03.1.2]|uniref:hypothetical protein n=1 Tax=Mesorhizobium sp. M9A.F.Ca.ET.002.03.1.2 TaxID=2493668 RepID=UPI001FE1FED4|nr:hypothetical protein [Mesorhizobium sp. M9A.F.Ca.ET.002.03.1.2]
MNKVGIARRGEQLRIAFGEIFERHTVRLGDIAQIVAGLDLVVDRLAVIQRLDDGFGASAVLVEYNCRFGVVPGVDDGGGLLAGLGVALGVAGPAIAVDRVGRLGIPLHGRHRGRTVMIVVVVGDRPAGLRIGDDDLQGFAWVAALRHLEAGGIQFGDHLLGREIARLGDFFEALAFGKLFLDRRCVRAVRCLRMRQDYFFAIRPRDRGYRQSDAVVGRYRLNLCAVRQGLLHRDGAVGGRVGSGGGTGLRVRRAFGD